VFRRLTEIVVLACALSALLLGHAEAEVPPGPRLALMELNATGLRLISVDSGGGDRKVIAGGNRRSKVLPYPFSAPSWSGDGARLAFAGFALAGKDPVADIYAADGAGIVKLPTTTDGFYPVYSPDGRLLAFSRQWPRSVHGSRAGKGPEIQSFSTWLLDLESGTVRQLTPWRDGLSTFPSSFSPDGSTLAITRDQERKSGQSHSSAVALRLDGSGSTLLVDDAGGAVFSPDGTRIALITIGKRRTVESKRSKTTFSPTDLAVAAADGSGLTRLTHTRNLELQPSWDPSGQRLAYTRFSAGLTESAVLGVGDSIMEINPDGTCPTKVLSVPGSTLFGATWQPGPGREAGPIAC
jgi:Tol biopolymer transport system component